MTTSSLCRKTRLGKGALATFFRDIAVRETRSPDTRSTTFQCLENTPQIPFVSSKLTETISAIAESKGLRTPRLAGSMFAVKEVPMPRRNGRKRKLPGHYCWSCDRRRPNERFSGSGRARHLCRDCAKLGAEELAYRQALRDLKRCMTWEGIIPRRRRKSFAQFLRHDDARIRALAEEMQIQHAVLAADSIV